MRRTLSVRAEEAYHFPSLRYLGIHDVTYTAAFTEASTTL